MFGDSKKMFQKIDFTLKRVTSVLFVFLVICGATNPVDDNRYLSPKKFGQLRGDEIIRFYGYPGEEHKVLTEDGYILTNFRIANPGGYPILLLHGMTATSDCWLTRNPRDDIAFLLWKRGYDVWMWNARGNIYSTEHVNMTYKDNKFFLFS
uniref:Lipase 1 n=1 Tax=Cacopsylla melanoneura TaxID=428564 RepID=A0A8D8M7N6_9HEMI